MADPPLPDDPPRPLPEPPRYLALAFGVVAATIEMAAVLWVLYCR
jgi:hypothetical protein